MSFSAEENLGKYYFQGDLLTTSDQMGKINGLLSHDSPNFAHQPEARALIKNVRRIWENGVVPFTIEEKVGWYQLKYIVIQQSSFLLRSCLIQYTFLL